MSDSCPGVNSKNAGKESACEGCPNQENCLSGESNKSLAERMPDVVEKIKLRMKYVKNRVIILSGKGGVGKSSVSVCLSRLLSYRKNLNGDFINVGLLDLDICGPSIPCMMNCLDQTIHTNSEGWSPVMIKENLSVLSVGFLLSSIDKAVIMRGPKKDNLITTLLQQVEWGTEEEPLDYLIIDTPPGTGDEILTLVNLLKAANCLDYAILVTTPQEVSLSCIRKSIDFCHKVKLPVLGIVENMTEFYCKKCEKPNKIFPESTKQSQSNNLLREATDFYLQLPLDPRITRSLDEGICPFIQIFEPEDFTMEKDTSLLSVSDPAFRSLSKLTDMVIVKTSFQ